MDAKTQPSSAAPHKTKNITFGKILKGADDRSKERFSDFGNFGTGLSSGNALSANPAKPRQKTSIAVLDSAEKPLEAVTGKDSRGQHKR